MPKQRSKHYPITGVASAKAYPRLNIDVLQKDPKLSIQWNLYLQAMTNLQNQGEDESTPLGFYQIAGIHGAPYIQWMEEKESGDRPGNYCTHGTALFLPWHRPYLLLLEQRIVEEALKLVKDYSPQFKEEYQEEALKIRIPYWDWATNSDLPDAVRNPETEISLPEPGSNKVTTKKGLHNPLYSYKFQTLDRRQRDFSIIQIQNFLDYDETKRCPDPKGNTHIEVADRQLKGPPNPNPRLPTDFRDGIYKLLHTVNTYGDFSNTGWKPKQPVVGHISIENYHNAVHDYVGCDFSIPSDPVHYLENPYMGHMTDNSVSAFDPIFWLHHCNVDRIYAMWQALHYKAKFEDQPSDNTRLPQTKLVDDAETTLRPFYNGVEKLWTSSMIQTSEAGYGPTCFTYNYHYPEVPFEAHNDLERRRLRQYVARQVEKLYGGRDGSYLGKPEGLPPSLKLPEHANFRREWMVFLHAKKYLVPGNFIIFFFLGEAEDEPHKWVTSPNRVGSFHTFKNSTDYCANCFNQQQSDVMISGGVDLTNHLYNALQGTGIQLDDQERVEEWLMANLEWKILKDNGTELDETELQKTPNGLTVGVGSFGMAYPSGHDLEDIPGDDRKVTGVIFDEVIHFRATSPKGSKGGLKEGDTY